MLLRIAYTLTEDDCMITMSFKNTIGNHGRVTAITNETDPPSTYVVATLEPLISQQISPLEICLHRSFIHLAPLCPNIINPIPMECTAYRIPQAY